MPIYSFLTICANHIEPTWPASSRGCHNFNFPYLFSPMVPFPLSWKLYPDADCAELIPLFDTRLSLLSTILWNFILIDEQALLPGSSSLFIEDSCESTLYTFLLSYWILCSNLKSSVWQLSLSSLSCSSYWSHALMIFSQNVLSSKSTSISYSWTLPWSVKYAVFISQSVLPCTYLISPILYWYILLHLLAWWNLEETQKEISSVYLAKLASNQIFPFQTR